jgi:hypothetical protein
MILNRKERLSIKNTYEIVTTVDLSLQYQLSKVKSIVEEIEIELDKSRDKYYIESTRFEYNIDFVINSFSVLIEYYHTWVIQKLIGLTNPNVRLSYKAIRKGDEKTINEILRRYSVGETSRHELYEFNFYEKSKSKYISAMRFLFVGKYHEIFVLNNYIKHNHMMRGYAPLSILEKNKFSFPYIYIDCNQNNFLNKSLLRCVMNDPSRDFINNIDDEYYKGYVNENYPPHYYTLGGVDIVEVNGLEYVISRNSVGLSIESVLETINQASIEILDIMINDLIGDETDKNNLCVLKEKFKARTAKTIRNSVGCNC